jgi:hypothetical protein
MHVLIKGTELEGIDVVYFLSSEAPIQVAFEEVVELVHSPDFRHATVEDLLPTSAHLLAVGVIYDFVYVVPVDKGDEIFGYVYDVLISIHTGSYCRALSRGCQSAFIESGTANDRPGVVA